MVSFPIFLPGTEFLKGFLSYPGGLIEYFSAFLSQFYYYPYLGSLIITIVAALISILTGRFITGFGNTRFRALIFVPALVILIVYSQYLHCLAAALGILVSLLFLWIYILTANRKIIDRLIVFTVLSILLYYAAGGIFLLFAFLCGIFELLVKRRHLFGLLNIFWGLFIPYVIGIHVFVVNITNAYTRLFPFHSESYSNASTVVWGLYIFFPLLSVYIPIVKLPNRRSNKLKGKSYNIRQGKNNFNKNKLTFLYESIVLLAVVSVAVFFSFDITKKGTLKINYFSYTGKWDQILKEARNIPIEKYNLLINHDVNKALYHIGRLPYDMFSYPQKLHALVSLGFLTLDKAFSLADLPRLSDTFIKLGLVNNAEHTANETMELIGEYPAILQQLFFINIVKGNVQAARVYLNALSKDIIFGKWAKGYLRKLDEDPLLSEDKTVHNLRSVMADTDHVGSFTVEGILHGLIHNTRNRMAFEYLMAYYLLNYQIEKVFQNIHLLDDYDYPDIPRYYEEAILIHININKEKATLKDRKISRETLQRFHGFFNILKRYNWNKNLALNALAAEFGDSYFFYYTYRFSGAKR